MCEINHVCCTYTQLRAILYVRHTRERTISNTNFEGRGPQRSSAVALRVPAAVPKPFNLNPASTGSILSVLGISSLLVCSLLSHLLNHLVRAVEDAACWSSTCSALGCLGEPFDGAGGVKVVATTRDDWVFVRLATYETREGDIFVRVSVVRGIIYLLSWVFGEFVELPALEV